MNDMIAFGNGDTACMNTYEIKEFLDERRPAGQNKYEHNKIVKKAEELMAQEVIKGRFKIDININQGLRGFKTVEGFEFIGEQGKRKGTGSKAGKALVGQRKLKRMEKELKTLAIEYVQPQLPFN